MTLKKSPTGIQATEEKKLLDNKDELGKFLDLVADYISGKRVFFVEKFVGGDLFTIRLIEDKIVTSHDIKNGMFERVLGASYTKIDFEKAKKLMKDNRCMNVPFMESLSVLIDELEKHEKSGRKSIIENTKKKLATLGS